MIQQEAERLAGALTGIALLQTQDPRWRAKREVKTLQGEHKVMLRNLEKLQNHPESRKAAGELAQDIEKSSLNLEKKGETAHIPETQKTLTKEYRQQVADELAALHAANLAAKADSIRRQLDSQMRYRKKLKEGGQANGQGSTPAGLGNAGSDASIPKSE